MRRTLLWPDYRSGSASEPIRRATIIGTAIGWISAPGARVDVVGTLLSSADIARFLAQLETLYRNLSGTAKLGNDEPTIMAEMACDRLGHIMLTVHITPDLMTQAHRFDFDLDQSHLPAIIADCRRVMERFPIIGSPHD